MTNIDQTRADIHYAGITFAESYYTLKLTDGTEWVLIIDQHTGTYHYAMEKLKNGDREATIKLYSEHKLLKDVQGFVTSIWQSDMGWVIKVFEPKAEEPKETEKPEEKDDDNEEES